MFGPFSQFLGQFFPPKCPAMLRTISHGFLAPCQNLEKTNDAVLRKRLDRRQDRRMDERAAERTEGWAEPIL